MSSLLYLGLRPFAVLITRNVVVVVVVAVVVVIVVVVIVVDDVAVLITIFFPLRFITLIFFIFSWILMFRYREYNRAIAYSGYGIFLSLKNKR